MLLTRLFAILIALGLLFGPLAMERAMAAAPASTHEAMATDGHCQPADDGKSDKVPESCCAAICGAAVVPLSSATGLLIVRLPAMAAPAYFHRGVMSELATPPPRG